MKWFLPLIFIIFPLTLFAADYTYSNLKPKVQRLQGVILFPVEIEQITVNYDLGTEQHYRYQLLRIRDMGQSIHQDRKKWVSENQGLMYEYAYGDLLTVVTAIEKDKVAELKAAAAAKLQSIEDIE